MKVPDNTFNRISARISQDIDAAIEEQLRIRERVVRKSAIATDKIGIIAGVDAAYTEKEVMGAAVTLTFPECTITSESISREPVVFPYLPGLFAFREGGAALSALAGLSCTPDITFIHGHGIAHPRRCGLASYIGVLINCPTIGVAEKPLVGEKSTPPLSRGSVAPVIDRGEIIGMAVRTKDGCQPVYVSIGHLTDLNQAVALTLATTAQHRLPEPIRIADRRAIEAKAVRWKNEAVKRDLFSP